MATRTLSDIVYTGLLEEPESKRGWEKQTVDYAVKHKTKIKAAIRSHGRSMNQILSGDDLEDYYMEVLMYLHNTHDYSISVAVERASGNYGNKAISLEGYIFSCVKFVSLRCLTERINKSMNEISSTIKDEDGEETSIFDTLIADKSDMGFDSVDYDFDKLCKYYEPYRYKYSIDLFEIWFIRLLTNKYEKKELYNEVLTILGIKRYEMINLQRNHSFNQAMLELARAISICGQDRAIEILKGYTYSADKIEKVVQLFEV